MEIITHPFNRYVSRSSHLRTGTDETGTGRRAWYLPATRIVVVLAGVLLGALVSTIALVVGCAKVPPKKPAAPPPSCYHTSAHKDWIDPESCRNFEDVAPVFIPEPEPSAK